MYKRPAILFLLFLTVPVVEASVLFHEFYLSLSEIRYNPQSSSFEISLRVFPDDVDRALHARSGIHTQLVTELEHAEADSLLGSYLLEQLRLVADGKAVPLNYLGKEAEADVMWCYLESGPLPVPGEITVGNSLLMEMFAEQVNIIQVYVQEWNRALLLTATRRSGTLRVGE
jgi:hypothetical protein